MPACVAHNRLPRARAAVVVVAVGVALVRRGAGVHGGGLHVDLGPGRAVEVPDVDAPVVRAGVDVALVGAGGGREVAADQRFEDTVAAEGDEGAVVGVGRVVEGVVGGEAVVKVCGVVLWVGLLEILLNGAYEVGHSLGSPVDLSSHRHPSKPSCVDPRACRSDPLHC